MTAPWLIAAAILVLPLAMLPPAWGIEPMQGRNALFIVAGLATVIGLLRNRWLQLFLAWAVVSVVLSGLRLWGMAGLLGLLAWALFYLHASRLTATGWRSVRRILAVAVLLQLAWMGLQVMGHDPLFSAVSWRGEHELVRSIDAEVIRCGALDAACRARALAEGWTLRPAPVVGFLLNPMDAALFLGLALPLLPWWLRPLTGIVMLVWLRATAGLAAVAITVLWFATPTLPRRLRWLPVVVVAALAGTYFVLVDPQGAGIKPTIWRHTLDFALLRPVAGWGPNAVDYAVRILEPGRELAWNFVFNEWVQGALELGGVGILLALGYVLTLAWALRHRWRQAGALVPAALILLVVSVFSIPMRIGPVALLGAVYLGRLEAIAGEEIA